MAQFISAHKHIDCTITTAPKTPRALTAAVRDVFDNCAHLYGNGLRRSEVFQKGEAQTCTEGRARPTPLSLAHTGSRRRDNALLALVRSADITGHALRYSLAFRRDRWRPLVDSDACACACACARARACACACACACAARSA